MGSDPRKRIWLGQRRGRRDARSRRDRARRLRRLGVAYRHSAGTDAFPRVPRLLRRCHCRVPFLLSPWTAALFVVAPIAGKQITRIGARPLVVVGLLLQAIGLGWIALIADPGLTYPPLIVPFVISDIGIALTIPSAQTAVLGRHRSRRSVRLRVRSAQCANSVARLGSRSAQRFHHPRPRLRHDIQQGLHRRHHRGGRMRLRGSRRRTAAAPAGQTSPGPHDGRRRRERRGPGQRARMSRWASHRCQLFSTGAGRTGRVDKQRREALHPSVDHDVVRLDAAFGQHLLRIPKRPAEPQAAVRDPADRRCPTGDNHLRVDRRF